MITVYNTPQNQNPVKRIQQTVEYQRKHFGDVSVPKDEPDTHPKYSVKLGTQKNDPDDSFPKLSIRIKSLADADVSFPKDNLKVEEQKFAEEGDYEMVPSGKVAWQAERLAKRFKGKLPDPAQIADSRKMNEFDADGNRQPERVNLQTDPAYGLDGAIMPGERPPEDEDDEEAGGDGGGAGGGDGRGGGHGGGSPPPDGGGLNRFVRAVMRPLMRDRGQQTTPRASTRSSEQTLLGSAQSRMDAPRRRAGYDELQDPVARRAPPLRGVSTNITDFDDDTAPLLQNNRRRSRVASTTYGTPAQEVPSVRPFHSMRDLDDEPPRPPASQGRRGRASSSRQRDVDDQASEGFRSLLSGAQRSLRTAKSNIDSLPDGDEEVILFDRTARDLQATFTNAMTFRELANRLRQRRMMGELDVLSSLTRQQQHRRQRVVNSFRRLSGVLLDMAEQEYDAQVRRAQQEVSEALARMGDPREQERGAVILTPQQQRSDGASTRTPTSQLRLSPQARARLQEADERVRRGAEILRSIEQRRASMPSQTPQRRGSSVAFRDMAQRTVQQDNQRRTRNNIRDMRELGVLNDLRRRGIIDEETTDREALYLADAELSRRGVDIRDLDRDERLRRYAQLIGNPTARRERREAEKRDRKRVAEEEERRARASEERRAKASAERNALFSRVVASERPAQGGAGATDSSRLSRLRQQVAHADRASGMQATTASGGSFEVPSSRLGTEGFPAP